MVVNESVRLRNIILSWRRNKMIIHLVVNYENGLGAMFERIKTR